MKKLLLVFGVLVLVLGVFAEDKDEVKDSIQNSELSASRDGLADAVAEVKAVIVKNYELTAKGDLAGKLALYAPDYRETTPEGRIIDYELAKLLVLSIDGKHPEEFLLLYVVTVQNNGVMPSAEMMPRIREAARSPEFVREYEKLAPAAAERIKKTAASRLKTLEFISVRVDGDHAVAVVEDGEKNWKSESERRRIGTISLRKVDGKWMYYRSTGKNK